MPHLTLEYSKNLTKRSEVMLLLKELHEMVGKSESVDFESVKSRLSEHEDYLIGADTSRRAFLFLRLEILPGRSSEWKKSLSQRLFAKMVERAERWVPPSINCSTNLDVREFDGEFYLKTKAPASH